MYVYRSVYVFGHMCVSFFVDARSCNVVIPLSLWVYVCIMCVCMYCDDVCMAMVYVFMCVCKYGDDVCLYVCMYVRLYVCMYVLR